MMCRERWGGLEAEGFGIVFLEAAACGVPSVAGRSGGSHEAVVDGTTGFVVDPDDVTLLAQTLERLLVDAGLALRMGAAARTWAVECSYDARVAQLAPWPPVTSPCSISTSVDLARLACAPASCPLPV